MVEIMGQIDLSIGICCSGNDGQKEEDWVSVNWTKLEINEECVSCGEIGGQLFWG